MLLCNIPCTDLDKISMIVGIADENHWHQHIVAELLHFRGGL